MLTDKEHEAIEMAGRLYALIVRHVIGTGKTRDADAVELALHIHNIQHFVMAQAAARAHPDRYRLSGESWQQLTNTTKENNE